MKYFSSICTGLFILLFCARSFSQNLELKDLNIPNAPAFTILDFSPAVIDKPGTAKAFSASIVSLITESNGLPKNFAIEAAPFWFFKNKLNAYSYHGISEKSGKQTNIFSNLRNASVSLGSVYRDSSKKHAFEANYASLGIRLNPIKVIHKKVTEDIVRSMRAIAGRITTLTIPVVSGCTLNHTPGSAEHKKCIEDGLTQALSADASLLAEEKLLPDLLAVKPVFQLDIAGALSWAFQDNSFSNDHHYRTGLWSTFELSLPLRKINTVKDLIENKNYFNLYGTVRYIKQDSTMDFKTFKEQTLLDFGGRLELEFKKVSVSFEMISRIDQDDEENNSNRSVGILQYKINEKLFLSGTFGKNFGNVNNIIALFGLNWGLGNESITTR